MVLDLGLLGGWAAGGVAVEAGNMSKSPAGAVDAANADVNALAGAFRQLVDAFAVEPAAGGIDKAAAAPACDAPAPAPSASPVPPVVVPDMFQPNVNVANVDVPAGSPLRRFTSHATTAAPAAGTHDESDRVEIPFSLFAPALEPRADGTDTNRTVSAKPAKDNDAVDADAESESHVEQAGQSSVVLTPMSTLMPMPPQTVKPAPIDTNTTSGRSAVNESEPRVAMPASEIARPASAPTQVSKPSPRSVPQSGPQFPLSSAPVETAAVDATDPAPIAVRAAESIPVNVAIAMAAMNAAAPSSRAPRANETSREPRVSLRTGINANANININAESDTIDVDRTPATLRLSQDAVRLAQAPSEVVPAALRLTASLLAAGYVPGAAARQFVSPNSTGAASASTLPVVVIPFVMPSTTSGLVSLASPSTAVDLPMAPSDVESAAPQIIQAIKLSWSRSGGEAHIRLDPRQFGDLSVSIRLDGGQVVARLQADAPAVREWLQTNQRTLQDGLAEHQLKLTRFEVVAPGEDAKDPSGKDTREPHDDAQGRPARRPKRHEHGERFEVVA
jgi:flagellar hook-length control protein FliK